jgi:hypothetical protein
MDGDKAVQWGKDTAQGCIHDLMPERRDFTEKVAELGIPERRHQADMVQTFKIVKEVDRVKHDTWFQLANE